MKSLLIEALNGKDTDRPPIWFMRQAGRILPSYMKLKETYSFHELMNHRKLASKVTLLPIKDLEKTIYDESDLKRINNVYLVGTETLVNIEGQNIKNGSSYDGTTFSYTPPGFTNEQNLKFLRDRRNDLLTKSDWTQSRDVTLSNDSAWQTYRQALRDLPSNTADASNPTWPTEPS